jgi:hypothetical protein
MNTPLPSKVPPAAPESLKTRVTAFYQRHGKKLWWAHSFYALLMGLSVIAFAKQGFEHAQLLSVSACAAWLLVVLFFRFAHKGKSADGLPSQTNETRGFAFYAMTYVLKNLYQGMLFFLPSTLSRQATMRGTLLLCSFWARARCFQRLMLCSTASSCVFRLSVRCFTDSHSLHA